jgi:hypothetical protein
MWTSSGMVGTWRDEHWPSALLFLLQRQQKTDIISASAQSVRATVTPPPNNACKLLAAEKCGSCLSPSLLHNGALVPVQKDL